MNAINRHVLYHRLMGLFYLTDFDVDVGKMFSLWVLYL